MGTLLFRKKSKLSAADKNFILGLAETAIEIHEHLASRLKAKKSTLPDLPGEDPIEAAQIARSCLGLGPTTPIKNLVNLLEQAGCICIPVPGSGIDQFDAFSIRINGRPVFVFDPTKPSDRIRFTLSHEVIHQVIHGVVSGSMKDVEAEANLGGSEFLFPAEVAREEIESPVTLSNLAPLKQRWGISIQALIKKAEYLDIISTNQTRYLFQQVSRKGWRKIEPGSELLPPERPRALRKMAEIIYQGNASALADATDMPVKEVRRLLGAYSAGPMRPKGSSVVAFRRR